MCRRCCNGCGALQTTRQRYCVQASPLLPVHFASSPAVEKLGFGVGACVTGDTTESNESDSGGEPTTRTLAPPAARGPVLWWRGRRYDVELTSVRPGTAAASVSRVGERSIRRACGSRCKCDARGSAWADGLLVASLRNAVRQHSLLTSAVAMLQAVQGARKGMLVQAVGDWDAGGALSATAIQLRVQRQVQLVRSKIDATAACVHFACRVL